MRLGVVVAGAAVLALATGCTIHHSPPTHRVTFPPSPPAGPGSTAPPGAFPLTAPARTTLWPSWGGGFVNVVSANPSGSVVLLGGDVAGIWRSTDQGRTFTPAQPPMALDKDKHVAAIFWADDTSVLAYVSTTRNPMTTMWASYDAGKTWLLFARTTQFAATSDNNKGDHPRETGRLVAWTGHTAFFAADDGVYRVERGGAFKRIALAGLNVTAVTADPDQDGRLYATADQKGQDRHGGLFVLDGVESATVHTEHAAGLDRAQDVVAVPDRDGVTVWVAAAERGVWRYQDGRLADRSDQRFTKGGLIAKTLAPAADGGLLVGFVVDTASGNRILGRVPTVWSTTDAGRTWRSLTTPDQPQGPSPVDDQLPDGQRWWLTAAEPQLALDGGQMDVSDLAYLGGQGTVVEAGRSNVWWSSDLGASWHPATGYVGHDVPQVVHQADVTLVTSHDWSVIRRVGAGQPVLEGEGKGHNGGFSLAVAPEGTVYFGGDGYVYGSTTADLRSPRPLAYADLGFPNRSRVTGLLAGDVAAQRVLLAATTSGVYRKVGGAGWAEVARLPRSGGSRLAQRPGTSSVAVVAGARVWTSEDFGATWRELPTHPLGPVGANGGFVLWTRSGTVLLSTAAGVTDATNGTVVWRGPAGPLAEDPASGHVLMWRSGPAQGAVVVLALGRPGRQVSSSGQAGGVGPVDATVVAGYSDAVLAPMGPFPACLDVAGGTVLVGTEGFGLLQVPLPQVRAG